MALRFTKNVANYVTLGNGAFGGLNGNAAVSIAAWVWPLTTTAGANDNGIVTILINTTVVGLALNIGGSTTVPKVRLSARSVSADARQTVDSVASVSLAGSWQHVAGIANFSAGTQRVFLNGNMELSQAKTYGNVTYTFGAPTQPDTIGGMYLVTPATTDQFDGYIGEVCVWAQDIGDEQMASVAKGFQPSMIRPDLVFEYFPMIGPEGVKGRWRSINGTIVGSIPQSTTATPHPRIIRR